MSNVKGRIAVDVQFTDSTTSSGVQSLKTVTLQDATEYTSGKVAVVTGTCGTAAVSVAISPSVYRNSAGSLVSFATIERVAFSASLNASVDVAHRTGGGDNVITSRDGQVAVVDTPGVTFVYTTAGTASFTLVIYGT